MTYNPLIKQKDASLITLTGTLNVSGVLSVAQNVYLGDNPSDIITISGSTSTFSGQSSINSSATASNIKFVGTTILQQNVNINTFSGSGLSQFSYYKIPNKEYKQSFKNVYNEYPQTVFSSSTARIYTNISTDYLTEQNKTYLIKATILAQEQRKINDSYYGNGYFGSTLALKDEYLFVGAEGSLSLFISGNKNYERISASTTQLDLKPPNTVNTYIRSEFSRAALYVSGNYLFGSAQNNSSSLNYNGSVHIFKSGATGWQYETYISSSAQSPVTAAYFGSSIASCDDYLFVGEPYATGSNNAGSVCVYQSSSSGWGIVQTITSSNKKAGDEFGSKILYYNNQLFVGSPRANGYDTNTGLIYIFNSGTAGWYEAQKISGSNIATSGSNYGDNSSELAIYDDIVVVGAVGSSQSPIRRGYVYLYKSSSNSGWQETQFITGGTTSALFGGATYITGNSMFVGARNGIGSNRGVAYYYTSGSSGWRLTNLTGTINYLSINHVNDGFGTKVIGSKNSVIIASPREYIYKNKNSSLIYQGAVYNYASQSDGNWTLAGDTNSAVFVKAAKYKNINGIITISDINTEYEYKDLPELNVNLASTGSYITIDVTGSSDRNFYWHATVEVQSL